MIKLIGHSLVLLSFFASVFGAQKTNQQLGEPVHQTAKQQPADDSGNGVVKVAVAIHFYYVASPC